MRHLYSDSICAFTVRAQLDLCAILVQECQIAVRRTRFERGDHLWPLKVVVFDRTRFLGYFDADDLCIGLHHSLMTEAKWPVVKNILRHELAHYLRWIDNDQQPDATPHSTAYRALCASFGWGEAVFRASANLEAENNAVEGDSITDAFMTKVKKLFALAESANTHEAEMATRKANELIVKYNLSFLNNDLDIAARHPFPLLVDLEVLNFKRRSQKQATIASILKTFGVFTVFSKNSIRAIGPEASVTVAEYVAQFLDRKLEALYRSAKQRNPSMSGTTIKNSFFRGIGQGYLEKIKQDQAHSTPLHPSAGHGATALSVGEQLQHYQETLAAYVRLWVYPNLQKSRSTARVHTASLSLGHEVGKNLQIAQPITSSQKQSLRFLQ